MLLRRVIEHVRRQEWTAVGIDFVVSEALRADPQTLRFLRLRVADLETRLADLTGNNRDVFEGFVDIGKAAP